MWETLWILWKGSSFMKDDPWVDVVTYIALMEKRGPGCAFETLGIDEGDTALPTSNPGTIIVEKLKPNRKKGAPKRARGDPISWTERAWKDDPRRKVQKRAKPRPRPKPARSVYDPNSGLQYPEKIQPQTLRPGEAIKPFTRDGIPYVSRLAEMMEKGKTVTYRIAGLTLIDNIESLIMPPRPFTWCECEREDTGHSWIFRPCPSHSLLTLRELSGKEGFNVDLPEELTDMEGWALRTELNGWT